YDPLLAKLIAWGNSREETIARLRRALEESTVSGIKTNVGLFRRLLCEPDFLKGDVHTKWLDELLAKDQAAKSTAANPQAGKLAINKLASSSTTAANPDARPATATAVTANSAGASVPNSDAAAIAAALWQAGDSAKNSAPANGAPGAQQNSRWKLEGRRAQLDRTP
ncbi:MAG TPA: hypothetical protein VHP80_20440, partial [Candidatus Acidoferrum sp.]|nr:hypothetical protein [Candidatus Acidoferrum sp.]